MSQCLDAALFKGSLGGSRLSSALTRGIISNILLVLEMELTVSVRFHIASD